MLFRSFVARAFEFIAALNYELDRKPQSLEWLRRAASLGLADAQDKLGYRYAVGDGVSPNAESAELWFRAAADQGHANGAANLAWSYYNGQGLKQDFSAALKLYELAASQGHAQAIYNLALMYADGIGTPKDPSRALTLLQDAAEKGIADAKAALERYDDIAAERQISAANAIKTVFLCGP